MEFHSPDHKQNVHNASISALEDESTRTQPLGPNDPLTPFPSILKLTREQENALCELAWKHYEDMDKELGRSETDTTGTGFGEEWFNEVASDQEEITDDQRVLSQTFFGKRLLYELTFRNKLEWRKTVVGGVFKTSNFTLSTSRRIAMQRIARFCRYFFESRPWFAALPQGKSDRKMADSLAKFADWKLYGSGSAAQFRQAVKNAAIYGEAVMKTVRATDDDYYEEELNVAVDVTGEPIVASDGDYILEDDLWMLESPGPMAAAQDALNGGEQPDTVPVEILERDGVTRKQGYLITLADGTQRQMATFEQRIVDRRTVHYSGAKTEVVYYRDFMAPLGAKDLHTANCVVHLYSIEAGELASAYAANMSPDTIRQAIQAISGAVTGETAGGPEVAKPRLSFGETMDNMPQGQGTPRLDVGEFYLRADPAGSGMTRDIMLVMDLKTKTPIFYNYTAVASPTRRRPFRCVREDEVDGRWFGQGTMERFDLANTLIDLFLNRACITQSRAGRVDFWDPSKTIEGQRDPNLVMNYGNTYTKVPNTPTNEILESVYLEDNKSGELQRTLEMLNQAATNESGTASANDSAMAGLDTSQLATGINNIAAAGNELTSLPIMTLKDGLTEALQDFVMVTYRYHDETETYTYFEGDVPRELTLAKRDVQNLTINVEILMTTLLNERQLPAKRAALGDAERFYALSMQMPQAAANLATGYRELVKGAGFDNSDAMIALPQMGAMVSNPDTITTNTTP